MSETKVYPKETMTVYGTGSSKHLKKGKAYEVHKLHGERLIATGKASDKPDAGTTKTKKEDKV